jgi:hypothetical protein
VIEMTLPGGAVVVALAVGESWPEPPPFNAYTWKSYAVDAASPVTDAFVAVTPVAKVDQVVVPVTRTWTV